MIESIDDYISQRLSDSNKDNCRRALYRFYIYLDEHDLQLDELTQAHLQKYADYVTEDDDDKEQKGENLSQAVASNEFNHLRGWLKSIDRGELLDSSFKYSKHLERNTRKDKIKEEDQYLSENEYRTLLDNIETKYPHRDYIILRSFVELGCRPAELANIKLDEHLDLDDRSVWINAKKGSKDRTVYFSEIFKQKLRLWIDKHRKKFSTSNESPYLLVSHRSPKVSQQAINKVIKKCAESADLQESYGKTADGRELNRVTATTLRHSYATLRLQEGRGSQSMDIKTLSVMMGHKKVSDTTTDSYINPRKNLKEIDHRCRPKLIPIDEQVAEHI